MNPELIHFTIDNIPLSVPKGTTVYSAIKQLGIKVPIFCYQDRMPPFGACRVCLVEVEKMGKLQASCTLEAQEGMIVRTQSNPAVAGRKEILELLLINHPLDCPICDRGGECPLQDQVVDHGPGSSRFYEEKRHFKKALPLGPLLMLDRERCIVCARCTRFSELVAGDNALEMHDRGYKTEVGTPNKGPVASKFIGNTIMICPVGALTSKVYRFRARPWDNEPTESSCTLCPVGCSMIVDSRGGEIVRTRSLENRSVNDIWLCDKGWFGYEFASNLKRLKQPLIRRSGNLEPASWEEALNLIVAKINESKESGKIAAMGGNPLTVEENFLFQKLIRQVSGVNNVDHRLESPFLTTIEEGLAPGMEMTIGDCEALSYAVLFGLDLTEEFPVIWLRLKQAINRGAKVFFFGHYAPEIAKHLEQVTLHPPGSELEILKEHLPLLMKLQEKGNGAFFVGRQYLTNANRRAVLAELLKIQQSSRQLSLNLLEGQGNSCGARLAGMRPDCGPMGQELDNPGLNSLQVLETAAQGGWDFLYVAGANPGKKFAPSLWRKARDQLKFLVVQDLFLTETAQQADVVLPTLSFVEKQGSFINIEGRVQKLRPGKDLPEGVLSDAEIFQHLAKQMGFSLEIDAQFRELLKTERVGLHYRVSFVHQASIAKLVEGEFAATFAPALFDHGVRMLHDPHLIRQVKEPTIALHPESAAPLDLQNGDVVRVGANGRSILGKVRMDKAVAKQTIVLPLGFDQIPVCELGNDLVNGLKVTIKKEYQHKFNHAF
ncbi:NADH-quinone oxidoreductase subunit G [Chlamydiales bacterium STE3]|nr:NADH-quinone oxidoreductase subunit G [Chlamydiales bacterium STE3]